MKKTTITLCLILVAMFSKAQSFDTTNVRFKSSDWKVIQNSIDTLLAISGHEYQLQSTDSVKELANDEVNKKFTYRYKSGEREYKVFLERYQAGGDANLEIPGHVEYKILGVIGKYLDLFPLWLRYSPNADKQKIAVTGSPNFKKGLPLFKDLSSDGYWYMRF